MKNNNFRYAGEFEKQQAVIICWPSSQFSAEGYDVHRVFAEVIKNLMAEVTVYVNCGIKGTLADCQKYLMEYGIDITKIHFTQFEDYLNWARDYGPDILTDDNGNYCLLDFGFNSYGMEDGEDLISSASKKLASSYGYELGCTNVISSELITEGGDKEFNGAGIMMTIEKTEVFKRNPNYSKEQIESEYKRLFHLDKVIWIPDAAFDDEDVLDGPLDVIDGKSVYRSLSANGHIDEMCRFIGKDTVLLAEMSDEEAKRLDSARITKERLDKAYEILSKETDSDGNPLKIVRIPCPEPFYITAKQGDAIYETWQDFKNWTVRYGYMNDGSQFPEGEIVMQPAMSYCNFLIVNGIVLGQKYWTEGLPESIKEKDEIARQTLEGLFPNRRVVMIHTTALNILGGGIHCITKNISF